MPNQFLGTKTPAGRAVRVFGPVLYVFLVVLITTLIGWGTIPWAPLAFFGLIFGVPILIFFVIPWLYGMYTWIKTGRSNFLWLDN